MKDETKAKPKRLSREKRISNILDAARQVFEQQGYEKATVAEIADKIGVVEGTVFSYFNSKRALVLKVMEVFYEDINNQLESAIKGISGSRNQLYYVIWNHLNVIVSNASICSVILNESRGVDKALSKEIHDLNKRYTSILKNILSDGIAEGEIKPNVKVSLMRNTIFGAIEHYLWDYLAGHTNIDLEKTAKELTELIYNGVSVKQDSVDKNDISVLIAKLNQLL